MTPTASPTDDEVVNLVADSIEASIRQNGSNIVFHRDRSAPERLIVHFSAFQLHRNLVQLWPGRFRVLLEANRNDMQVRQLPIERLNIPFIFEFKVPWSGDMVVKKADHNDVLSDLEKVSKYRRGYAVTVFLKLLKTPAWAAQRDGRRKYNVEDMKEGVIKCLAEIHSPLIARVVQERGPIRIEFEESQIECTVTMWRPELLRVSE